MTWKDKVREFLDTLGDDDEGGDGIREDDAPTNDADVIADGATDGGAADEGIDEDIDESGDGDDEDEDGDEDGDEGAIGESEESVETLRASLVKLGIENERLRTRLAELGGDAAAASSDLDADEDDEAEDEDEIDLDNLDEDEAEKDRADQLAQIARLRGGK